MVTMVETKLGNKVQAGVVFFIGCGVSEGWAVVSSLGGVGSIGVGGTAGKEQNPKAL